MKILVIAEDEQVLEDLAFCLKVRYPEAIIVSVAEGLKGVGMVETESPNLVIVDSAITDIEIPALAVKIRDFSDVALIVLCGEESEIDRAKGLEAGVDEYATKPFSPIEFLSMVRALLRRTERVGFKPDRLVCFGNELSINFISREVFLSGKPVKLTPFEYEMLSELARNEGRVLTHRSLIDKIWGSEYVNDYSFTKRCIYRLRKKLNDDPNNPRLIHTERGIGYKFIIRT